MPLVLLALVGCGSRNDPAPVSESRLLLDTVCTVTLYDPVDQGLVAEALDLCAEYEALLSRTIEGSDIWRINNAGGSPVFVDGRTALLLREALGFSALSGGLFDITVGRLCVLWDFTGDPAVPSPDDLALARGTVDYRQVLIEGAVGAVGTEVADSVEVRLGNAQAWLDLGGIAKGYIADQLAAFLKGRGVKSAVIDLGGNIVTVGKKPNGGNWNIGVNQPFADRSEIIGSISVGEASIVTSGIYERMFIEDGTLYHHILDPLSGMPAAGDVVSVTVVSERSMVGDALTTILVLVGSEGAQALLERVPGVMGAVLVLDSGELLVYGDIDFTKIEHAGS